MILVTYGDCDHAEYVVQVAEASGAPIVCGPGLANKWQRSGLSMVPVESGDTIEVADLEVQGIPVQYGGLTMNLFRRELSFKPGSACIGAVGLLFTVEGRPLLNLGDPLLLEKAWRGLQTDVLMISIGGMMTMDVEEPLRAAAIIEPQMVIPVHYNWHILFYRRGAQGAGPTRCAEPTAILSTSSPPMQSRFMPSSGIHQTHQRRRW